MKRGLFTGFALAAVGLASCDNKEDPPLRLSGTYSGTYQYYKVSSAPGGGQLVKNPVSVTFTGGNFTSSSNTDRIPAGGSGVFAIKSANEIAFEDSHMWTADFDWGLILDGDFIVEQKGDSLFIARKYSASSYSQNYRYALKKQ